MNYLLQRTRAAIDQLKHSPRRKSVYLLCYTALFVLCAALAFCHFALQGKSFIWSGGGGNIDGISQHYVALSYWGTYLRDIVRTLFTEGRLHFPLFDTSIGWGGDVLQTLSYYVLGDPLNLLSALVPRAYTEYLYQFLILVRLYLAGLAFSAFALHLKKGNRFYTLIGSMVYLFTGYMLYAAVRHPYFSNPMIYLPLILLGAEYIFKGKKPWLFILSVALAGLSNFYFFYMICIFTVIYVLVRAFDYCPKGQRKKIFSYLLRFGGCAILAVLMACVLFYPSIRTTLASSRQGAGGNLPALYDVWHYISYLFSMPTAIGQGSWDFHGALPLSMIALFLLFASPRGTHRTEKRLFLLGTIFLLIPFFGWLINGTAYVSNRWVWSYNLLIACICAFRLPALATMSKKKWVVLLIGGGVYAYATIPFKLSGAYYQIGILGLLLALIVTAVIRFGFADVNKRKQVLRLALLVLTVVQVADISFARFSRGNYVEEFMPAGESYNNVLQAQGAPLTALGDESFHRYEDAFEDDSSRQKNAALVNGGQSTNIYFSLASDTWYDLARSLGHKDAMVQKQIGLDNRTVLGALTNVKYFTVRQKVATKYLPYGYAEEPLFTSEIKDSQLYKQSAPPDLVPTHIFGYYENKYALPFGYTYDSYITREEYDSLSYTDRQRALLNGAVLEAEAPLTHDSLPVSDDEPQIEILCDENVERDGNIFRAKGRATLRIRITGARENCETYFSIGRMEFNEYSPVQLIKTFYEWDEVSLNARRQAKEKEQKFVPADVIQPTVKMHGNTKKFYYYTPAETYYAGVHDFSINMGYRKQAPTEIQLILPLAGEYLLEDIKVEQLDFEDYGEKIDTLRTEHLENVLFEDNRIRGEITVSENKLLCMSLPYGAGWTAYVDGKEQEILKTDLAFMGLMLEKGTHTVELRYFTPYLSFGLLCSAVGWSIFIIWFCIDTIKRKKKEGCK